MALPLITAAQRYLKTRGGSETDRLPVLAVDFNPAITALNALTDGTIDTTNLNLTGTLDVDGAVTFDATTDSTTKDTGGLVTQGGVGIEKSIFAGLTINAGTSMTVGTDITGAKEVDHNLTVATTTTAATAGGKITVKGGTGATSGAGGAAELIGGAAGATAGATGGAINITGGAEGAGLGITGAVNITTQAATGGAAGNIIAVPGTSSSTTISPVVILGKGVVNKKLDTSVATGATATAVSVVGGHLSVTGATGNLTLPTAADLTTAIGATPVGTTIEFVVNAVGMTAGNVVTLLMGANIVAQKQISAGDSATDQLLTVTNTSNVNMGIFRICYITATTCSLHRIG